MRFHEIESLANHDETEHYVNTTLNTHTPLVKVIFDELRNIETENCSPRVL